MAKKRPAKKKAAKKVARRASGSSRRAAPPLRDANGARRFERADGAVYVWRNVDGQAVRTLARSMKPTKGDRVLTVDSAGRASVRTVGLRGAGTITDAIARAADQLRAGVGLVIQAAATRVPSKRKALERRLKARAAGLPPVATPASRAGQSRMGATLGIEPGRTLGQREGMDYVASGLATRVGGTASFTLHDVFNDEGALMDALHSTNPRGLLALLVPGRSYVAQVTIEATTYGVSARDRRYGSAAQGPETITGTVWSPVVQHDASGDAAAGALACAIYHAIGDDGYRLSSGAKRGREINTLHVEIDMYEIASARGEAA